jgi:meso-butanediol dehydrogenase / (S,S)-butanediol dehydrogenase / diacetyl reductase
MTNIPAPDTRASAPVAVVTGAARGIGLGIAQWFLAHGWRVAAWDNDSATLAEGTRSPGAGHRRRRFQPRRRGACHGHHAGAFRPPGRAGQQRRHRRVQAGARDQHEEWRRVLAVNLHGPFLCTQAAAPLMLARPAAARGGQHRVSISGLRASTLRVAYGTSKAALIHLTKQHAVELGTQGIRVNAIAPGPVDTEMAKLVHSGGHPRRLPRRDPAQPLRHGGRDRGGRVLPLQPEASYINGQVLAVDGGFDAAGVGLPTLRRRHPRLELRREQRPDSDALAERHPLRPHTPSQWWSGIQERPWTAVCQVQSAVPSRTGPSWRVSTHVLRLVPGRVPG